jgi:hypothetical protein
VVTQSRIGQRDWVFLVHRLPRTPSAPRIAIWRSLRRLGAVLIGDGVVALPASARTQEHLEWLAADIGQHGGSASVWLSRPSTRADGDRLASESRQATEDEYQHLLRSARGIVAEAAIDRRSVKRLRRELRLIGARDYFGAPSGPAARAAVEEVSRKVAVA